MIKRVLFTAALLVPLLAYGATPTANLSVQVVPVPVVTAGACTASGAASADANAAGFTTCALYNDFTTPIPNSIGTGLPSNWLNCTIGADTGAVWNLGVSPSVAPCPGSFTQVTDPVYGGLVLDLNFNSSYLTAGQQNLDWLSTMPTSGTSTNLGAHSFSTAYVEWTARWSAAAGAFGGNTQGVFEWGQCCGTAYTFVDLEITEQWPGQAPDYGWNSWLNGVNTFVKEVHFNSMDKTVYNTVGILLTGNNTNYSVCAYLNGSRVECDNNTYPAGTNAGQRKQIYLWNGVTCDFDPSIISCAPTNFGNTDLYIKNIKVLTCAASVTGGSCLNNTYNGSFYTP